MMVSEKNVINDQNGRSAFWAGNPKVLFQAVGFMLHGKLLPARRLVSGEQRGSVLGPLMFICCMIILRLCKKKFN